MNVLVLAGWFPTPLFPDHGDFVLHQCMLCVREGLPVRIVTADLDWRYLSSPEYFKRRVYQERLAGVSVTKIQGCYWPKWNHWSIQKWAHEWDKALVYDSALFGMPDLLHAHTWWAGVVAQRWKERYGIPYVLTEHSTELFEKPLPGWKKKSMVTAFSHASLNVAVGEDLEKAILSLAPEASTMVFPNFLDTGLFHPGSAPEGDVCHFGFSGSLIQRKRPEVLVEAFQLVAQTIGADHVRLHIAGEGILKAALQKKVERAGLTDSVRFYGALEHGQMPDFYRQLSVLVSPSSRENFSLSIAEALACGVPVISSRYNAWEGFLHDGNGLLMQEDDLEGLVKCMVLMVKQWRGYDRRAISDEAVRTHGASNRVPQLARLYQDVLRFK